MLTQFSFNSEKCYDTINVWFVNKLNFDTYNVSNSLEWKHSWSDLKIRSLISLLIVDFIFMDLSVVQQDNCENFVSISTIVDFIFRFKWLDPES